MDDSNKEAIKGYKEKLKKQLGACMYGLAEELIKELSASDVVEIIHKMQGVTFAMESIDEHLHDSQLNNIIHMAIQCVINRDESYDTITAMTKACEDCLMFY